MKNVSGSDRSPRQRWFLGAFAVFFLAACATGGSPGSDQPDPEDRGDNRGPVLYQSMAEMLRARAPGVQVTEFPGGGISIRIPGSSSFQSSEAATIVIDGMVMPPGAGGLGDMDPNIVESIRVLKNADATAVYGARGANGVIEIKTKKGGK